MTQILTTRDEVRSVLRELAHRSGLAPTMGALHAGHEALIARSARENPWTVVSVFVNPTQFGSAQDLARYPRDLDADIARATSAGATHVFIPSVDEIYGDAFDTWVEAPGLAALWEGASRPGHFRGVCTIVSILLNLVRPRRSYFGEKDFQQLQIIRRMHRDLALPGEIVGCDTLRDIDGVALSSRNQRLSPAGRLRAAEIPRALKAMRSAASAGETCAQCLVEVGRSILDAAGIDIDYLAVVNARSLLPEDTIHDADRILLAVEIDGVRLIDNSPIADR
jgi:pantoate--beta-alanine ligase